MDPRDSEGNNSIGLHHRFRAVIMLLTLVSAINYDGRPLFLDDSKPYVAALEEGQPTRNVLLNAVTALLVRNHEIIATVINASYEQVLVLQQSEQPGDPDSGTDDESDGANTARHPRNLTAITRTSLHSLPLSQIQHTETYVSNRNFMLAEKGTSHRQHFGKWDELLHIPATDPLVNHAATLEDILNTYRSMSVQAERVILMVEFSEYIVALCWQKMFRRVVHWSSRANFRWLIRIDLMNVQASYDQCLRAGRFTTSRRNDSMLAGLLMGREGEPNLVEDLIKQLCPFPQYHPDISKLVKSYDEKKAPKGSERRMGWYTKDTCIEFHKLLISALITYTNALRIFKRLRRERVAYADQLWKAAYLLWRVSDSQILRHHLANELSYPFRGMDHNLARDLDKLYGYITPKGHVKVDNSGDQDENEMDDENDDEGGNTEREGEDNEEGLGIKSNPDLEKTCLRCIQLHATYWKAQDIVTSLLHHHTSPEIYEISVVQGNYPSNHDRKMVNWMTLVRELSLPNTFTAQEVIDTIKEEIARRVKERHCDPIFKKYNQKGFKPRNFTGNLHAEVLLALMLLEIEDDEIIQKFDTTLISVSKLCCPVCWDTLELLRGVIPRSSQFVAIMPFFRQCSCLSGLLTI